MSESAGTPRMDEGTYCCPICSKDSPHTHDKSRWIGVDFDGTLAHDTFDRSDPYELGEPIWPMVHRVQDWLAKGYEVRLFTARMHSMSYTTKKRRNVAMMETKLREWCNKHIGKELVCTNQKDGMMEVLWDDRAVRVPKGTGSPIEHRYERELADCRAELERTQKLADGWMKCALDMAPNCTMTMVFMPDAPEAFAMSRAPVIHKLEHRYAELESRLASHAEREGAEPYWLIERGSPAEWWVRGMPEVWTRNAFEAQRFTEWGAKTHAKELEAWGVTGPLRATEHLDLPAPSPAGPDALAEEKAALEEFTAYFVHNYPGPHTIIHDPKWHAPKIFRAAQRALLRSRPADSRDAK